MVDGLMSKRLKAEARRPGSGAILACERWTLPRGAARENDFALLSATGKPFSGNCGCRRKAILADNSSDCSELRRPGETASGGCMDLAMAMAVTLFGMFAASTVYFFYKLER
jgi:hypothetical protein